MKEALHRIADWAIRSGLLEALRQIANWAIKTGLLMVFSYIGWITLHPAATQHSVLDNLLVAAVIALVFVLVIRVVMVLAGMAFLFTCGLALVAFPFIGYFTLKIITLTAPDFLTTPANFWFTALIGLLLVLAGIPGRKKAEAEETTEENEEDEYQSDDLGRQISDDVDRDFGTPAKRGKPELKRTGNGSSFSFRFRL